MKMRGIKTFIYAGITSVLLSSCFKEDVNEALGTNNPEISIYALRNIHKQEDVKLGENELTKANHIKALVVSSHEGNNFPKNYIAVQNEWRGQLRGILVEIDDPQRYRLGDSVDIWVDELTLGRREGMLALLGADHNNTFIINRNNTVTAKAVSIGTLNNQFDNYESTYVEITSDLEVEPNPGDKISGSRPLADADGKKVFVTVGNEATFANEPVAPSATFRGIVTKQNENIALRLLTYADMAYPSGKIYAGWPETFENPDAPKNGYANRTVVLSTGPWWFQQTLLGITPGRDRIVSGVNAVRFQQNHATSDALLQMDFDVPDGASKVTFFYGSYWNDPTSWFKLEYSTDKGTTWHQVNGNITDAHTTTVSMDSKQAIFLMNIPGPVRFRLNRPQANNVGGRLGVDDFAIFRSY